MARAPMITGDRAEQTEVLHCRVEPKVKKRLEAAAKLRGVTVSALIRNVLRQFTGEVVKI